MKQKYNVALVPIAKSDEFVSFVDNLSGIAGMYQVNQNSLPHITLCQFMAAEDEIEIIWEKVLGSSVQQSIELTLGNFSCISIDNNNWVSLLPDHLETLMKMHCDVANLIESRIGRCFDKFDAHMTLINSTQVNYKNMVLSIPFQPIKDVFILSLGKSDDLGQLTKLIYSCNFTETKTSRIRC